MGKVQYQGGRYRDTGAGIWVTIFPQHDETRRDPAPAPGHLPAAWQQRSGGGIPFSSHRCTSAVGSPVWGWYSGITVFFPVCSSRRRGPVSHFVYLQRCIRLRCRSVLTLQWLCADNARHVQYVLQWYRERKDLVVRLVFKTSIGRITPSEAGSIPALSVFLSRSV